MHTENTATHNEGTLTLTDFLLARIADDEDMARNALALGGDYYDDKPVRWHWISTNGESTSWQPSPVDPSRVIAECEAKRRIVWRHGGEVEGHFAQHDPCRWAFTGLDNGEPCGTLRDLAAVYADHADYRDEWRP